MKPPSNSLLTIKTKITAVVEKLNVGLEGGSKAGVEMGGEAAKIGLDGPELCATFVLLPRLFHLTAFALATVPRHKIKSP